MNFKKYFFWLTALAQIIAIIFDIELLDKMSKSALMFGLLVYFWDRTEVQKDVKWVRYTTLAIVFTWIGDIMFVLFVKNFLFFFVGISSYFAAHIFFLFAFWKASFDEKLKFHFSLIPLLAIAYVAVMAYLIVPYLDGVIQVPVSLYALSTLLLVIFAWYRRTQTTAESFIWVILGVILIIISDSVLAINRFSTTIPFAQYVTTICFIGAYWFIINGLMKHFQSLQK
jgi:hypothetical protein